MSDKLLNLARALDTNGSSEPQDVECSRGCRHFLRLEGQGATGWGLCSNKLSPRAGQLASENQGCVAFEPLVDPSLSDAQLISLIGEASKILTQRRQDRMASAEPEKSSSGNGEVLYDFRLRADHRASGRFPTIFRLERHEHGFVAVRLEAQVGHTMERTSVKGRFPAKNGEIFKIVREDGSHTWAVPCKGHLNILQYRNGMKEFGRECGALLNSIGPSDLETFRPFFEGVEDEIYAGFVPAAKEAIARKKECLEDFIETRDRWRNREFLPDDFSHLRRKGEDCVEVMMPDASEAKRQERIKWIETRVTEMPTEIAACEATLHWLETVDRSNPTLKLVATVPTPDPTLHAQCRR